ncbi:SDR family oxidoreductase [Microbispora triticiradicis]|uniref:SDR family oxidoreductase n=3 Tax=Microbispora TaxID=2005 RepID=A0ABY3LU23_9ACTN|nr:MULTISPECIES: SDR family oxidoreductase [Microbispora]RGA02634.1 SDR family oxidoreductase [Microbispora triticiradicis]TLP60944.1 SDR family oxidoreductase [Microbispora fusca]TYB53058.1 SDR family oxidoreductase [Microbispora tritici]GLW26022.1 oxidoreductase [Microbispora amethystogenes]
MTSRPVVVVTGGTRGIGRGIVELLCADGYGVVFTHSGSDADAKALEDDLGGRGALVRGVRLDVTEEDAPARLFDLAESAGEVTGLVNNAGVTGRLGPFAELTDADLRRVVEVNLVAPVRLCREAARRWSGRTPATAATTGAATGPATGGTIGRVIVNVTSVAARTGSPGEYVAYAATKAAAETLTVGLARELGPAGIRVNAVSPGTIDTTIHARAGEPGRAARVAARVPLGRPGKAEEIAEAVRWLLSDRASYVNGAVLEVAGGL